MKFILLHENKYEIKNIDSENQDYIRSTIESYAGNYIVKDIPNTQYKLVINDVYEGVKNDLGSKLFSNYISQSKYPHTLYGDCCVYKENIKEDFEFIEDLTQIDINEILKMLGSSL